MTDFLMFAAIFIIGSVFGSFITAASWRLPREEDMLKTRSQCPKCKATLKIPDLIPIFSWLLSRGKCRYCKSKISPRYVLTEIITGLLFVALCWKFGLSAEFLIFAGLGVALLILIISDFETYIIPDSTTIATIALGLIYQYRIGADWFDMLYGVGAGVGIMLALRYVFYWALKREALGWGDIKFMVGVGIWLGFPPLAFFMIISGVIGIVIGVIWKILFNSEEFPFGPSLAITLYFMVIFPEIHQALLCGFCS
ncbi:MAG: hypothetical protein COV36_03275 [Alphaproteobacteria bacterium CG11_big_fil_rev_8_21_14_0_20_44_7]|nr:MAG: hypothetical protein COV36_03275 [Alphaproteobacteria bacterium CG11_big_fil_rev_8_21_14_0_20_44_7]